VDVPVSTTTVLATRDQVCSANEQMALAGFLAGYSGLTREAYALDLRQYVAWCTEYRVAVFCARRVDIECFARRLESLGRAAPRSLAGSAPWPASIAMRNRKVARCRRAAARRPGGRQPRRSADHMRFDRAQVTLDRHATYIQATFLAGASR
jgi:hypothetical protein